MLRLSSLAFATLVAALPGVASAAPDGAKVLKDACSDCHHPKRRPIDALRMSREKWKEAIDKMANGDNLDPPLKKEQISALLDYLEATQGSSNAATASPAVPEKK